MLTTSQREAWNAWLTKKRHISFDVAKKAGLKIGEHRLHIPIRDKDGKILFFKYRRAPWIEDGAKYTYDTGATAALFGAERLNDSKRIILTEGELDALALRTLHYTACSTTGGAQAFRPEWAEELLKDKDVTILYDADKAGVEGALRVARMMPSAKIAWVPVQYGKDASDVIASGHVIELHAAIQNPIHFELPSLDAEPEERLRLFGILQSDLIIERRRIMGDAKRTPFFVDLIIDYTRKEIKKALQEKSLRNRVRKDYGSSNVEKAREYPIARIVRVNARGFAKCPYHEEKSPSMKVYQDGHCFSFCCGKRSNAIDLYMAVNSCDFKTAIKALTV